MSFLLFLFVQDLIISASTGLLEGEIADKPPGAISLALGFFSRFFRLKNLAKGLVSIVLTFGILSIFLPVLGIYNVLKGKMYKYLIGLTLLFVPNFVLWVVIPTPQRHFIIVAACLASLASFGLSLFPKKITFITLCIVIVSNFFIVDILYKPIVKTYSFTFQNVPVITGRHYIQIAVGSPIYNHIAARKLLQYTYKEYDYLSSLPYTNIIVFGKNKQILYTLYAKNYKIIKRVAPSNGVRKVVVEQELNQRTIRKTIYFVSTLVLQGANIYGVTIQALGNEYNNNFHWYVNPLLQPKTVSNTKAPPGLKLIPPFVE